MIQITIKAKSNGDVFHLNVENVFTASFEEGNVVLHFAPTYDFKELLNIALEYGWELYRYPSDGHVGLTISLDEIFRVKTIESVNEG